MKVSPRDALLSMLRRAYGRPIQREHLAPHQISAVSRLIATLEWHRGAILADEVGLGKSFVAAGVAREAFQHELPVELIVPAALVAQWRETLDFFRLDLPIETHDTLARRDSFPGAAPERLIIVDEAHRFRNPATKRYKALALRSVGHRLLLVTATPICNSIDDLAALIRLIAADDELLLDGIDSLDRVFDERDRAALSILLDELVVRRGRNVLGDSLAFGRLERNRVSYPVLDRHGSIAGAIEGLEFPLIVREEDRPLVRGILWRRLESSDAALVDSLRRQSRFYRRARESLRDGFVMTKRDYLQLFGDDDGEPIQELLFPSCWLDSSSNSATTIAQVDAEIRRIDALSRIVNRDDAKLRAFEELLQEIAHEPVLIFTGSVATAMHLYRTLRDTRSAGVISSRKCALRDDRRREREEVLKAFRRSEVELLISTDLGAEGLNLQNARSVIHYDLPWNPVKLDQRNGRAWRIGQRRPSVRAVYFIPEEKKPRAVLAAISRKNRVRRSLLSDSASILDEALCTRAAIDCERLMPVAMHDVSLLLVNIRVRSIDAATLIMTDDSRWLDHLAAIESAASVEMTALDSRCLGAAASIERRLISRGFLRPRLRTGHPCAVISKRVEASGLAERELIDLLSARYRAGVEILLGDMAREHLDVNKIEFLREVLARESRGVDNLILKILAAIGIGDQRGD